jgi:hypothetical protein
MLTPDRNINYKILTELDDRSLVNICSTDKKTYDFCQDERFWEQLVMSRFPYIDWNILNRYRGYRSWSNYYIKDLRKINNATNRALEIYLMDGVVNNRLDHVMIAIHKGADPNTDDGYPLLGSIERHNFEIFKYLAENGANIKGIENDNWISLWTLEYKDYEMFKYLADRGAVNGLDNERLIRWLNDVPGIIYIERSEEEIRENKDKIEKYIKIKLI